MDEEVGNIISQTKTSGDLNILCLQYEDWEGMKTGKVWLCYGFHWPGNKTSPESQ